MKFFLGLLLLANNAFATMSSQCEITEGFFLNSPNIISDLKFETMADVFSLSNAKGLSLRLEDELIRFSRSEMNTSKQSKLVYVYRKKGNTLRTAKVIIDRSPFEVLNTSEFYGIVQISSPLMAEILTYNFYCHF